MSSDHEIVLNSFFYWSHDPPLPLFFPQNIQKMSLLFFTHFLTRPRILYPKLEGYVNGSRIAEKLKGTITVKWCPVTDSSGHSVSYTLDYSDNEDGPWEELATDLTTPEYEWDTTTIEDKLDVYLKVVAECSEGLTSVYSYFFYRLKEILKVRMRLLTSFWYNIFI